MLFLRKYANDELYTDYYKNWSDEAKKQADDYLTKKKLDNYNLLRNLNNMKNTLSCCFHALDNSAVCIKDNRSLLTFMYCFQELCHNQDNIEKQFSNFLSFLNNINNIWHKGVPNSYDTSYYLKEVFYNEN